MPKRGYVYLLGDSERENVYKIGVTTGTIENRIKKLQTGNSGEIFIVNYFLSENPFFVEKWLHKQYYGNRVHGEWFEMSIEEKLCFLETCEKYEKLYLLYKQMKNNLK